MTVGENDLRYNEKKCNGMLNDRGSPNGITDE
jgi:hypothetical protein